TIQLVDKSLVIADEQDGQQRYRMLETIREYARETLSGAGESDAVRSRHLDYFLGLAEREPPGGFNSLVLMSLNRERDNLRAALRWAIDSGDAGRAVRLGGALWDFWSVNGHYTEGRAWLADILALPAGVDDESSGAARARALQTAGHLANAQADYASALTVLN